MYYNKWKISLLFFYVIYNKCLQQVIHISLTSKLQFCWGVKLVASNPDKKNPCWRCPGEKVPLLYISTSYYKISTTRDPQCFLVDILPFTSSMFCITNFFQTIPSSEIVTVLFVTLKSRISVLNQICRIREFEPNTPKALAKWLHQEKKGGQRGQRKAWWRWWGAAMQYAVKFSVRSLSLNTSRASISCYSIIWEKIFC